MKAKTFLKKLFKDTTFKLLHNIEHHNEKTMLKDWHQLQDNMDLLARELHMEVEEKAKYKRVIKHDEIRVDNQKLLSAFEKDLTLTSKK